MDDEELYPVKSYSAGHLFFLAKAAYERTKGGKSPQEAGKSDAIIAIILSASSLEAFINELPEMASAKIEDFGLKHPEIVKSFAVIMKEIEDARGSIRLKFFQANLIFTGNTYDSSQQPFQDFSTLIRLRDALLHLKPQDEFATNSKNEFVRISTPKPLSGLPKNLLAKHNSDKVIEDWMGMISTQAVAGWACNTASSMVQSVLSILPESHFRKSAINAYGKIFQPVNNGDTS